MWYSRLNDIEISKTMLYFVWIGYNIESADLVNENSFTLFWLNLESECPIPLLRNSLSTSRSMEIVIADFSVRTSRGL